MPYTFQCFAIGPKNNRVVTESPSGFFPTRKPDYYFYNVGKTTVYCEAIYGTAFGWIGTINGMTLNPGEKGVVSTGHRAYYYTGQKIYNRGDQRALVHAASSTYSSFKSEADSPLKMDINKISKALVSFGVGKIPVVGGALSGMLNFFWPNADVSVWDQIKDQLTDLVDNKVKEAVQGILGGDIRSVKEKITVLQLELDDPKTSNINIKYMIIAEELIGFEKKFSFSKQDSSDYIQINYYLLPMYSTVINLKLLFYQFGIVNQSKLKLSNEEVYSLKKYISRLIEEKTDGAIAYVRKAFRDQFENEYETCDPDRIFDHLAVVRCYCALNGFEFFEYWKAIANDPFITKKPYNTAISYSTIYARPTPILSSQIVPDDVPVPLQPKLVNGKRNRISKIIVHIYNMGGNLKIKGIKIFYENGDDIQLGNESNDTETVDFNGKYLKSLEVWGRDALDVLGFHFYDGSKQIIGSNAESLGHQRTFELDMHHICGIMIVSDASWLAGQAAGLAVSYQLLPEDS